MNERTKGAEWLLKEKYSGVESREYFDDLRELEMGTPLAYLIGHVPFLGTTIYLDSHPLIPRAETEYWIEKAITSMSRFNLDIEVRILDLCAGSGCIGVALLKALPNARVDFAEVDASHHRTIWKNVAENGIADDRVTVYGSDLFEEVCGTYDYVYSNPPYIDPAKRSRVAESVLLNEPHTALFGGQNGTVFIERILLEAPAHLNPGGTLYLEHEPEQTHAIHDFGKAAGFQTIVTETDQYNAERVTILRN